MNKKSRGIIVFTVLVILMVLGGCSSNNMQPDTLAQQEVPAPLMLAPATKTNDEEISIQRIPQEPLLENAIRDTPQSVIQTSKKNDMPFSMVWMSDTQLYCESYPEIFFSMSDWTVKNKAERNIQYVLHTGDVVNDRTKSGQWKNAKKATQSIMEAMPHFVVAGNHDTGSKKPSYAEYAKRFGPDAFQGLPSLGGFYKDGMGRYDLFEYGTHKFIIAGLGYAHDQGAIDWLNGILKQHADYTAILCFHSYLNVDGKLTSHGQKFFEAVVKPNANVQLVLSGHKHGVSKKSTALDDDGDSNTDRTVQAILGDYQGDKSGGAGYLRILEFDPGKQQVSVTAYSPYKDSYRDEADETFTFNMKF